MRSSLPLLSACLLLSTSAGASVQTLATATENGRGNINASVELGGGRFALRDSLGATAGEVALTWGMSDRADITARFGLVSGYELGIKRAFHFKAVPQFVLAPDARFGLKLAPSAAVPLFNANFGVIAEWSPVSSLRLLASPRLLLSSSATESWFAVHAPESFSGPNAVESVNSEAALIPAGTLGLAIDVNPSVRLFAEAGWIFAPVLRSWGESNAPLRAPPGPALRGVTAAFAIQWRPQDLGAR